MADKLFQAALAQVIETQVFVAFIIAQEGDFLFQAGADGDDLGALGRGGLMGGLQIDVFGLQALFVDVGGVNDRLGRQKAHLIIKGGEERVIESVKGAERPAAVDMRFNLTGHVQHGLTFAVGFAFALQFVQTALKLL